MGALHALKDHHRLLGSDRTYYLGQCGYVSHDRDHFTDRAASISCPTCLVRRGADPEAAKVIAVERILVQGE